jgi:type IV secretion system protein VirB2
MRTLPTVQKTSFRLFLGLAACLLAFPDIAAASGGITEFSSPLEQVVLVTENKYIEISIY